ncbi:HPr family phosphocarrier protein [Streptomyces sp. NPDC005438]|uniref:HPr family phosphocarrier protein n=1 Tax=Streptomyces sp. NPDC005438 TaxID=3156880 RepID=UPI0033BC5E61
MAERQVTIGWPDGLHARPAAVFCRAAAGVGVPVTVRKEGGDPVNAASMLGVLALGAEHGQAIVLAAEGEGAEQALDRMAQLVSRGLDELPAPD